MELPGTPARGLVMVDACGTGEGTGQTPVGRPSFYIDIHTFDEV